MEVDRNDSEKTGEKRAGVSSTPPKSSTPSPPQETTWILHGLNRMQVQIDKIADGVDKLENRLRNLERHFWVAIGILVCAVFISRVFLPDFDITITPKP